MKNVTLSADGGLIAAARVRAHAEKTTLNEQFRRWLASYADARGREQRYDDAMAVLRGKLETGRRLTRDEMNER
ncbi:MAG: hypothetical protein ABIQ87_00035 [Rubrivivax sp.]